MILDVTQAGGGSSELGTKPGTIKVGIGGQVTRFNLFAGSWAAQRTSVSLGDPPIKMSPLLVPGDGVADFFAAVWTDNPGHTLHITLFLDTDWQQVVDGPLSILSVELVKSSSGQVVLLGESSVEVNLSEAIDGVYVSQLSFKQENNLPDYDESPRVVLTNMSGSAVEVLERTQQHALEDREVYVEIVGRRLDAALALDDALEEISARVVALRELEPLREVDRAVLTRLELRDFLTTELEKEGLDEILRTQVLLSLLGLIPYDTDLFQLTIDLITEQALGLYDSETERMYLVGDSVELTPRDKLILAHEYLHALQQQHFDWAKLKKEAKGDSEASTALSALIEGDAYLLQFQYMIEHLTEEQQEKVLNPEEAMPVFDDAPYVIRRQFLFDQDGIEFVFALFSTGQWEAVNAAFKNPPVSTEQIMHPAKYLLGEKPVEVSLPDIASALGEGWSQVQSDSLGESFLRTYLETDTGTTNQVAADAAAGWGGDRYTISEGPDGGQVFVALIAWDTETDAQEFFERALGPLAGIPERRYAGIQGDRVLLIVAPSREQIQTVRDQFPGF